MGSALSKLCDCTNKDPRTEINMFLTQNQTIQFSSSLEDLKTVKKDPLTYRSGSTIENSRQILSDYKWPNDINPTIMQFNNDNKKNKNNNNKLNKNKNLLSNFNKAKNANINHKLYTNNINIQTYNSICSYSSNNSIYIGEKKGKIKHGLGLQIWNKGSYFFGNYRDNKTNGIGKLISGKNKYKGEFKNDEANGFGIYSNNKITYEGFWNNDLQSNYGIEKWEDGSIYRGQYSNGKKNGIGVYIWGDGNKYEGEFVNNKFHGYGIYVFNNNKYYLGNWENNEKSGYGEFVTNDKIFIGFYSKDKRNGLGISSSKMHKKIFIGFWKNGNKIGPAKVLFENIIIYRIIDKSGKLQKISEEKDFFLILEKEGLSKYKNFFKLSFEDISKMINNINIA